ncbi:response regulator [Massilia glaciei]|uniref:DNA-binding response regulator n=1 Tax=Massilia glaciei TaxID=1524097 RepID=A0A2U2I667_9BURK|nr:response regulator [Massilia glaciei]PWF55232.1 DNA-binding response regulator [Massilia glaciei]
MQTSDHILVVDDDDELRDLLRQYLEKNGFKVSTAANGRQMRAALAAGAAGAVDMIVLDLMLPGEDGLALCRSLHADGATPLPILMLTARNEESDRILGLEMGADDYLTKPFASRELLARIRAILRRARMVPAKVRLGDGDGGHVLRFGAWQLDTRTQQLLDGAGVSVALTGAEYRLLRVFIEHPQRVLTRDQLLGLTQGREAEAFDRSIDILVSRLRKRLRDDARPQRLIQTVRSGGYLFAASVDAAT